MAEHIICSTGELPPGKRKIVNIGARSIGIFNLNGEYYALLNVCPHQGAELCEGPICGTNQPVDDYRYDYIQEGELVRCARHGWEFNIRDGSNFDDPSVRAKTYRVSVADDKVVLHM